MISELESRIEKKMSIIRQKFTEARRMSKDETLCRSDEFQDALENFNSNREVYLSMFSQHLYQVQYSVPQTKQITVLRPSKIVDSDTVPVSVENCEKQANRLVPIDKEIVWDMSNPMLPPAFSSCKDNGNHNNSRTTQIVVLKPSSGKTHDIKANASPAKMSKGGNFSRRPVDDELQKLKMVPNENLCPGNENITGHRRDETLLSPVFSNGCVGVESSFCISENEYKVGNLCDSDYMSSTSRHAWDHINNRIGSHHSSSSFGRASYSPESPVGREAKKRISERWALIASNKSSQKQKHPQVRSSTLGEMLALSDARDALKSHEGNRGISKEQESRDSSVCLNSNFSKDDDINNSPRNLLRSRSVPITSTVHNPSISALVIGSDVGRTFDSEELNKRKSGKSSFRGKVSNLFRSRNNKRKEKNLNSPSKDESSFVGRCSDTSSCVSSNGPEENMSPAPRTPSPDLIGIELSQGMVSREPTLSGTPSKNQEQPSPVSVLEPSFEESDSTTVELPSCSKPDYWGTSVPSHVIRSSTINESSPVERMAPRKLSWDEEAIPFMLKPHSTLAIAEKEEDWHFLIQTLLLAAGLYKETDAISFVAKWHSPECPLGPSFRRIYVSHDDKKQPMSKAKRWQRRSNRKLVFDCVNAALVDITGYESVARSRTSSCNRGSLQGSLADQVWAWMKEWCMSEEVVGEDGDDNGLVVERVVWKEVVGAGWEWVGGMRREVVDGVSREIGGKLLDDLLEEAVFGLTGDR